MLNNVRRIYILGDLHLGIKNASIEWVEIQSQYLLKNFIESIDEDGFNPDLDILVQVGDWHHVRESTNVRIQNTSIQIAKALTSKFKKGIHIIVGNHDVYYKDRTDVHSLEGMDKMFDNLHVYSSPKSLIINGKHKILMFPWIDSIDKFKSEMAKFNNCDYMFCHADIKGASLGKTTKLEHGVEYSDLTGFKKIYSGHIHIRQNKNNVVYVGTPYQMDRGDCGNIKGYYVLDIEGEKVNERFIENKYSPKFLKYNAKDILNMQLTEFLNQIKNNFVDVYIEHTFASIFPVTKFIDLLKDSGMRKLEFQPYSSESIQVDDSNLNISNYEYNIFDVLGEYLKARSLPVDKSELIRQKFKEINDELKNNKSNE
jgi:UDP-2,3-diacylglucosamine pyrophosphatase LpxH